MSSAGEDAGPAELSRCGQKCTNHCGNRLPVYQFPMAAVTNGHKLGGLKQQKFFLSQFWRPEVQDQSFLKAKVKVLCSFQRLHGRRCSLPLMAFGGF